MARIVIKTLCLSITATMGKWLVVRKKGKQREVTAFCPSTFFLNLTSLICQLQKVFSSSLMDQNVTKVQRLEFTQAPWSYLIPLLTGSIENGNKQYSIVQSHIS